MSISLSPRPSGTPANPTRQQLDELDALLQRMLELPVDKIDAGSGATPTEGPSPLSYTAPDEADAVPPDEPPPVRIDFQALKQRLAAQPDAANDVPVAAPAAPPPVVGERAETPANDENWVPLSSTWQPSSLTWKPLAKSWQQAPPDGLTPDDAGKRSEAEAPVKEVPVWEPVPVPEHEVAAAPVEAVRSIGADPVPLAAPLELAGDEPIALWATPLVWVNGWFDQCLTPLGPVGRLLCGRVGRLCLAVVGLACLVVAAVLLLVDWIGWTS